jgi:parvulin-like peptidyl-prolyl isomerase
MVVPRRLLLPLTLLLLASLWPAICSAIIIEKVMAVVNGEVITLTEVQEESIPLIRRISAEARGRGGMQPVETTEKQILEGLIDRRLQLQEAMKQGITVSAVEVDAYLEDLKKSSQINSEEQLKKALAQEGLTLEKLKKDVEGHLILLRIVGKEVRSKVIVSEQEVRKAYEEEIDQFIEPTQVKLRYLLIAMPAEAGENEAGEGRKKAEAALAKLNRGGDFSQIVKEYSSGPMAEAGGDMGYVKKGELHPEVDKVAFSLKVGQYSEIISIPSGFVIIKVEEKRTPIRPYTEVADQIREKIYEKKVGLQYREWTQELRAKAFVEMK